MEGCARRARGAGDRAGFEGTHRSPIMEGAGGDAGDGGVGEGSAVGASFGRAKGTPPQPGGVFICTSRGGNAGGALRDAP